MTERLSTKHTPFLNGLLWRYWHRISYKLRGNWSDRSQWLTRAGAPSPPHGGKPGCHLCPRARTLQIPHPDFFLLPSISLPLSFLLSSESTLTSYLHINSHLNFYFLGALPNGKSYSSFYHFVLLQAPRMY